MLCQDVLKGSGWGRWQGRCREQLDAVRTAWVRGVSLHTRARRLFQQQLEAVLDATWMSASFDLHGASKR